MLKKTIFSVLALFSIILVSSLFSLQMTSAEIIWSLPTEVEFTIVSPTFDFSILSPINKVYRTKSIPIELVVNKPASCSYSLDNNAYTFLGNGINLKRTIRTSSGSHNLRIKCNTNSEEKIKSVDFKVKISQDNNFNQVDEDNAFEEQIIQTNQPRYSEWTCINNKLQRIITINNLDSIEYGGVCGLELTSGKKAKLSSNSLTSLNSWIILLPLILILLILIALVSIILVMFLRK
ncbi:hypothetical protein HYW74_02055 [Candidatus Pacearchaeota archaeon]|nr:hypothetical protein [Candidatus Pacearchaeota archaeon]